MSFSQAAESRYGVHSIDHFALEVPSLAEARTFFNAFGLDVSNEDGRLLLRTAGEPHVWGVLREGPRKRLAYLSFNCYAEEYEALRQQLRGQGVRDASTRPYASEEGAWYEDAAGNLFQVRVGPKTSPQRKDANVAVQVRAGERGVPGRQHVHKVQPRRLSHVLMFTPDIDRAIAFYRDALGLRLSDQSRGIVAFLHGRHGSDHHLVAFVQGSARGWHHSSWDVPGIEDVGNGAEQMRLAGYAQGWGTGRHVLGSNYFHYVRDPWGSFAEYSAHMDYVPAGTPWTAGDHRPEDSLYLWGPEVPAFFTTNTEAAS
ncbi:MAG: metapyrocatechase [Variovorax sp.]|nr:MAG: metapyrocatechase [Variovorax sp.]